MNKGYIISAQNSGGVDYIACAETLCRSIKAVMQDANVTLLTDKLVNSGPFDRVILYPWGDTCSTDSWKLANDWQTYFATPYEYTIKLEADMYIPRRIDHWWNVLTGHDLVVCSTIRDHKGNISSNRSYRRLFDINGLPDVYNAITYFKRSTHAELFFNTVRDIFQNWIEYKQLLKGADHESATTDVVYALASIITGVDKCTLPRFKEMSMVHMKKEIIGAQLWDWTKQFITEITPGVLRIETVPQLYPLHYNVKNFASHIDGELSAWK